MPAKRSTAEGPEPRPIMHGHAVNNAGTSRCQTAMETADARAVKMLICRMIHR